MAQLQWNVPIIGGKAYRVGLYHGEDSGHVLVYINNRVTIIDFGVTDSKDYSFFLEQELFELKITKSGASYDYALAHNEEIDTPHNRQRRRHKRYEKWNRWVGGILLMLFMGFAVAVCSRVIGVREQSYTTLTDRGGEATIGRVFQDHGRWSVQFVATAEAAVIRAPLAATDTLHPLGFPLQAGDELSLHYLPSNPKVLRIAWEKPPPSQLDRYRDRVLQTHLQLNPGLAPRQAACQLGIAYDSLGLTGLALFFHQHATYNDSLNRAAYLRFVRNPDVAEELRACL